MAAVGVGVRAFAALVVLGAVACAAHQPPLPDFDGKCGADPGGSVRGSAVNDSTGEPIGDVVAILTSPELGPYCGTMVDRSGRFSFEGVPDQVS